LLNKQKVKNMKKNNYIMILLAMFVTVSVSNFAKANDEQEIEHNGYGFSKIVDLNYDEAVQKLKEELKKEGFGALTEVDVKQTLKSKLDVNFKPYKIIGACNPPFAYQALQAEEQIGLLLPCNVIVYVNDEGLTVVAVIDPIASMEKVKNEKLENVAKTIQEKLKRVLTNM